MRTARLATTLIAATVLAAPVGIHAAYAEGGGGSEAEIPPTSAPCARLTAVNANDTVAVKNASRAQLRFEVSSCSAAAETVTVAFTRTWSYTVGGQYYECVAPGWAGPTVTLRPGDKTTFDVTVPGSGCPYGTTGASSYVYATASDAGTGVRLATATASVTYKTGF